MTRVSGGFAYFRLRNESYDESQIEKWAAEIAKAARHAEEVYVYLRHDDSGENAVLAQQLARLLNAPV